MPNFQASLLSNGMDDVFRPGFIRALFQVGGEGACLSPGKMLHRCPLCTLLGWGWRSTQPLSAVWGFVGGTAKSLLAEGTPEKGKPSALNCLRKPVLLSQGKSRSSRLWVFRPLKSLRVGLC